MNTRSPMIARTGTFTALAATVLVGCGGIPVALPGDTTPATTRSVKSPLVISVTDNLFEPSPATARVGQHVVWEQHGGNQHNIVAVDAGGPNVSAEDFVAAGKFDYVFAAPGTYRYYCTIHGTKRGKGMAGSITIEP
jgi:plastocyanin